MFKTAETLRRDRAQREQDAAKQKAIATWKDRWTSRIERMQLAPETKTVAELAAASLAGKAPTGAVAKLLARQWKEVHALAMKLAAKIAKRAAPAPIADDGGDADADGDGDPDEDDDEPEDVQKMKRESARAINAMRRKADAPKCTAFDRAGFEASREAGRVTR